MEEKTSHVQQEAVAWSLWKTIKVSILLIGYGIPELWSARSSDESREQFLSGHWIHMAIYNSVSAQERSTLNSEIGRPRE